MKTCDVCGNKIGLMNKFKYADGYICKECYRKASRQFTETIIQKDLAEIKELCNQELDVKSLENFEMTGRIGNYLLVDEKNHRICIPNNRMTNQKVDAPEFYDISNIKQCEIKIDPYMDLEELEKKVKIQRDESVMNYLTVQISTKDQKTKNIQLIDKPVRIKSYAFRQSFNFAKRIKEEINRLMTA
ncbi:MAG: DUF4428 domain-containing protein [Anaerostipes sp.]|jgi:hypothetical protein